MEMMISFQFETKLNNTSTDKIRGGVSQSEISTASTDFHVVRVVEEGKETKII